MNPDRGWRRGRFSRVRWLVDTARELRRRDTVDRSWYAFPPRRRPLRPAAVVTRLALLAIAVFGVLVALGAIR